MVYSTESAKWKAYQFSDPFAAGSFYVCNKITKTFCRPDCDARARTNLKSEIKFVSSPQDAIDFGYHACESCDPMSLPSIDVNLLVRCVAKVNRQIGFLPPLLDENEEKNNQKIKENIIESKKTNEEQILNAFGASRRSSVPVVNYDGKFSKDFDNTSLSKNDSDHYRLVDLACRHLALAAAMNIFQLQTKNVESPGSDSGEGKKRRRRGGVLGFKELAAKSKLSAWHFHRVFKSVTGLTPKTYGDKCWEFIKNFKDSGAYTSFDNKEDYQTPVSSNNSPYPPQQSSPERFKASPKSDVLSPASQAVAQNTVNYSVPQANFDFAFEPVQNMNWDNNSLNSASRALSAPDLTFLNRPLSLFSHTKANEDVSPQQISPMQSQSFASPQVNNQNFYIPMESDIYTDMNAQLGVLPVMNEEILEDQYKDQFNFLNSGLGANFDNEIVNFGL